MVTNETLSRIIKEIMQNKTDSFVLFISLTQSELIKTAFVYLRDTSAAQDVVSDFYCDLQALLKKLKNTTNILGWCKTIIINRSLNTLKRKKREIHLEDLNNKSDGCVNAQDFIEDIFVRDILSRLDEKKRTILVYRSYGFTLNEISTLTGFSVKKVRTLEENGKRDFLRLYNQEGI